MALNSWQLIKRVSPGTPFGNGQDGDYSSATIPTLIKLSCSGTAASTSLTASSTTLADGDLVIIHQSRGTGAGQWEINKVASGGGTVNLVMQQPLYYTYTDSGASQAQVVKIFQYRNVTVASGTWTVPTWDKNVGGILPFAANVSTTVTGTISASGKGYVGSAGSGDTSTQGEGTAGGGTAIHTANGNGAGGAGANQAGGRGSGAGGGHATSGTNGSSSTAGVAIGGSTAGNATLTSFVFGGAGSGAGGSGDVGAGGSGGGMVVIFAKTITITGAITTGGNNGGAAGNGGGGGAGGAVLIEAQTATLGTNKITAPAGSGGSGGETSGGAGGVGRIHLDYLTSYTGTTTPTLDASIDLSLAIPVRRGFYL